MAKLKEARRKKIFAVLFFIFLLFLGFYEITKSQKAKIVPTNTKNWKVYENKDFGVTFSYPADLYTPVTGMTFPSPINPKVFTDDLKTVPIISLESNQPQGPSDAGPLSIEKFVNTTMDSWLEKNRSAEKTETGSYFSVSNNVIKKTNFQGFPAYLLTQKTNPQVPQELYLVQVKNDVYYVAYLSDFPVTDEAVFKEYNDKFDKNTKPIIKAILTSIRFP